MQVSIEETVVVKLSKDEASVVAGIAMNTDFTECVLAEQLYDALTEIDGVESTEEVSA